MFGGGGVAMQISKKYRKGDWSGMGRWCKEKSVCRKDCDGNRRKRRSRGRTRTTMLHTGVHHHTTHRCTSSYYTQVYIIIHRPHIKWRPRWIWRRTRRVIQNKRATYMTLIASPAPMFGGGKAIEASVASMAFWMASDGCDGCWGTMGMFMIGTAVGMPTGIPIWGTVVGMPIWGAAAAGSMGTMGGAVTVALCKMQIWQTQNCAVIIIIEHLFIYSRHSSGLKTCSEALTRHSVDKRKHKNK